MAGADAERIWTECWPRARRQSLELTAWRVVESQEQAATLELVDTPEEQEALEIMLEHTKPPLPPDTGGLHYLLATPFRYPPLPHGSRFGTRAARGILYAALALETALAECAYYRLVFLEGLREPFPDPLRSRHSAFALRASTRHGQRLECEPWAAWQTEVSHPARYTVSQPLGERLREAGVEAITYASARAPGGLNLALFTPRAVASRRPLRLHGWTALSDRSGVAFVPEHQRGGGCRFTRTQFLRHGRLPAPAA